MKFSFWGGIAIVAGLFAGKGKAENLAPTKPNILLILADDLGFSDLGCYGSEIPTPNLDRLAADGLRFTQFYTTARCWPSRAAILTGYYANQIRRDPLPLPGSKLANRPKWAQLLPQYLKPLGYRSYYSGKWHIDGTPAEGGFEHSYLLGDLNRYFSPQEIWEDGRKLPAVKRDSGYYTTVAIADYAIKYLKEHAAQHPDQPFFEYVAFNAPHFPLQAPQDDIARYKGKYDAGWNQIRTERYHRELEMGIVHCGLSPMDSTLRRPHGSMTEARLQQLVGSMEVNRAFPWNELTKVQQKFQAEKMEVYAAMIDRMDREIGRIIDQLKKMGCYDNTIILFTSDNGGSAEQLIRGDGNDPSAAVGSAGSFLGIGPGWATVANTPFRLYKIWVNEGGISAPLIVHWPKGIKDKGVLRRFPCHLIDIVPTLVQVAGGNVAVLEKSRLDAPLFPGQSLLPVFANDQKARDGILWWYHEGHPALREGDWKLVADQADERDQTGSHGAWKLYNLSSDRSETNNLIAQYPEKAASMIAKWGAITKKYEKDAGLLDSHPVETRDEDH